MEQLSGFPYFPVQFTKEAAVHNQADVAALQDFLQREGTTDLIVISHGWNNNMEEAKALYASLFANVRSLLDAGTFATLANRKWAVLGVLWPSKKFEEKELIPSGAAGAGSVVGMAALKAKLEGLKGVFDAPQSDRTLDELQRLLPKLEDSTSAQKEFVDKVRSLVQTHTLEAEDGSEVFFKVPSGELLEKLRKPVSFTVARPPANAGGRQESAPGRRRIRGVFQRDLVRRPERPQLHHLLSNEGASRIGGGQWGESDPSRHSSRQAGRETASDRSQFRWAPRGRRRRRCR